MCLAISRSVNSFSGINFAFVMCFDRENNTQS